MDYVFHRDTNNSLVSNHRCQYGSHGFALPAALKAHLRHAQLLSHQSSSLPAVTSCPHAAAESGQGPLSAGPRTSCASCQTFSHIAKASAALNQWLNQKAAHNSANGTTNFIFTQHKTIILFAEERKVLFLGGFLVLLDPLLCPALPFTCYM